MRRVLPLSPNQARFRRVRWLAPVAVVAVLPACGNEALIDLLPTPGSSSDPDAGLITDAGEDTDTGSSDADASLDAADGGDGDATPEAEAGPAAVLLHRYDFEGEGTDVLDRVGDAHGTLMGGAVLDGSGGVELNGVSHYVDLPNGLVSGLSSLSVVVWLEWHGALSPGRECWQRIFDFGNNSSGEGQAGVDASSLFLTPWNCNNGVFLLMYEASGPVAVLSGAPFPSAEPVQAAAAIDGELSRATLYVNGAAVAVGDAGGFPRALREEEDLNDWLGRSQWVQDTNLLYARYDEFRIYTGVLTEVEVADLYERGPDEP